MAKRRRTKSGNGRVPLVERAIALLSPKRAFERAQYRAASSVIRTHYGRARLEQARARTALLERRLGNQGFAESYRHAKSNRTERDRTRMQGSSDAHATATARLDLMERCRDLERNNAIARGMFDRVVDNVVATGFTLQVQSDDEGWNKEAEARMLEWGLTGCDVGGRFTFDQMQRLALRSILRDGDVGFGIVERQLQPLEADRIVSPTNLEGEESVVQGVEMDKAGRPVAYWVSPYGGRRSFVKKEEAQKWPAKNFIHLYDPERFSSTRGVPALASCMGYFDQLDSYIEAELVSARVAACLAVLITGESTTSPFPTETEEDARAEDQLVADLEPGAILNMSGVASGDAEVVNPNKPPSQFGDFVSAILRFLGLPLGLPIELISLDFKYGSYSSARLALLQAYRSFRAKQTGVLRNQFLRRVYRWKISQFMKHGPDPLPMPAGGMREAWRHVWLPAGWEWIDPDRESKANALALDRGLSTLKELVAERGLDAQEVITQRAQEIAWAIQAAEENDIEDWRWILRADTRNLSDDGEPAASRPNDEP